MTEFGLSKGFLLKVNTNKNSNVFRRASDLLLKEIPSEKEDAVGIIYSDFNADMDIAKRWKTEYNNNMRIFHVAARGKTLNMDDKISFGKNMLERMRSPQYMPPTYIKYSDIPSDTPPHDLFFVKKAGSSCAKGVNAHFYKDMANLNYSGCVIQKDSPSPDLIDGYRYKIRAYVILFAGQVYLHRLTWGSRANTKFEVGEEANLAHLRKTCVVCQREGSTFFLTERIERMDEVFENVRGAAAELKHVYSEKISKIEANEFVVLGIDFVVTADKQAHMIEINHRSNYEHPTVTKENVDIPFMKDVLKLLVTGSTDGTQIVEV